MRSCGAALKSQGRRAPAMVTIARPSSPRGWRRPTVVQGHKTNCHRLQERCQERETLAASRSADSGADFTAAHLRGCSLTHLMHVYNTPTPQIPPQRSRSAGDFPTGAAAMASASAEQTIDDRISRHVLRRIVMARL
jgi:hypothetical protein